VLSGYRILWFFAFFDLPVMTKSERRAATRFRLDLLNMGFSMVQYSVYGRPCNREGADAVIGRIKAKMPLKGKIALLTITDRQYGALTLYTNKIESRPKIPEQYTLF